MTRITRDGHAAVLTLDRPDRLNALSFEVLRQIDAALRDPVVREARVLLVTGAGARAFCAGADIDELRGRSLVDQRAGAALGQAVFARLADLPIVSVAAIDGFAFGGGLELALACTFRVATPTATFGLPEVKLGLIPGYGGTQRLPRLIGEGRALEIILTGRTVAAEEAERIGLVSALAEDALAGAKELAGRVVRHSLPVIALARDAVRRSSDVPLAEGLRAEVDLSTLAYQTADASEGMAAFMEKRSPVFVDG